MRRLFLQINVSLDGFIEDAAGEIDWHFADAEFDAFIDATLQSIDAMVFGRVAFEKLARYWRTASPPEASEVQVRLMHELPKYVVSDRLGRTEWNNSHTVGGDIAAAITALKQQPGGDIALFAGGGVATSFVQLGLIDEYRLIVNPVLLGAGTRLFGGGYERSDLRLIETRRFASGALVLFYEPTSASAIAQ
jgi:dihydrofolate reductase